MKIKQSFATQVACYESFLVKEYKPSTISQYSRLVLHFLEWKNADIANQTKPIEASILEYIDPRNQL